MSTPRHDARSQRSWPCATWLSARFGRLATLALTVLIGVPGLCAATPDLPAAPEAAWRLVAWNDLGMHCLDADFSAFAILPPYNTIHAQLIDPSGVLVTTPGGLNLTYEAVADATGSINRTSIGKTNFWDYVADLFGVALPEDKGLAGHDMPGAANTPQPMTWTGASHWWSAEGIPITPTDDALGGNAYPMMRIVARDGAAVLAETRLVLPVSDEMDCSACHASGSGEAARPTAGWVNDPDPQRDYRRNVLRLHDQEQLANPAYVDALAANGFDPAGLETTVNGGRAVLCAACHPSNALPGSGIAGLSPLTGAVHTLHGAVADPVSGLTLGTSSLRDACYRCHPGSTTRCLRGAMGKAIGADGLPSMQCQDCHGNLAAVGAATRTGWLDQPTCQNCHTGTAVANAGEIRFTTVFTAGGLPREAVDPIFATEPDVPAPGFDLYRFSFGHGGLACEACHGSTHAIYPSSHANDNVQSVQIQGHAGMLTECLACHSSVSPGLSGPHGLHPLGQVWVEDHASYADTNGTVACRDCHGTDGRGTVLSTSQRAWIATTDWGARSFFRGAKVGCYACHNGPDSEAETTDHAPVATSRAATASAAIPLRIALAVSDSDGDALEVRIVDQPAHGSVAIVGFQALLYPDAGFDGADTFTFAAWDGKRESNLATVTLTIHDNGGLFADGVECGATTRWSALRP